uniref:Uncharacterized protein n=1 Tax=Tanacetum cinerariifolium TaxID=118510 RepID=A0A6L2LTR7_TANCI|nr:hypothetical protein [Tanacetum cinerariifolium]
MIDYQYVVFTSANTAYQYPNFTKASTTRKSYTPYLKDLCMTRMNKQDFMYDTDDGASISGKSCEHFGWDLPKKDSPEVAGEVMEIANDQDEELFDQEVADDCLDDERVKERIPSKRIRDTHGEMVKDENPKKANKDPLVSLVRIVLKCAKINKIRTISTQDQKPQRKAGS